MKYLWWILFLFLVIEIYPDDSKEVLSPIEMEIFQEMNYARTNPKEYANILKERRTYYNETILTLPGAVPIITKEGVKALDEAIMFLIKISPLPSLKISNGLCQAAKFHAEDQGTTGSTGHKSSDGKDMEERISIFGQWNGKVGENICYRMKTGREVVISLLVDDGISSRGHRNNIYDIDFNYTGISFREHKLLKFITVITYANEFIEK